MFKFIINSTKIHINKQNLLVHSLYIKEKYKPQTYGLGKSSDKAYSMVGHHYQP